MAHLVCHDFANLRKRALLEQIIVQRDTCRTENSRDIRADPRRLTGCVYLKDLFHWNLICPRHCKNGLADFRFRQRSVRIEEGLNKYRRDEEHEKREHDSDGSSPDPPRFRCSPKHRVQSNRQDCAADEHDSESNQLVTKPCRKTLGGESVSMLANEVLVNVERKAQDINEQ